MEAAERYYGPLTSEHLDRLSEIASTVFTELLAKPHAKSRIYRDRLLLIALCQGAALHFIDQKAGVKDLDVWGFFRDHPSMRFPPRVRWVRDFGPSALGRHPHDQGFAGRRIDIMGRSVDAAEGEEPVSAMRRWLTEGRSRSASHLAEKAVIAIHPPELRGQVVWPAPQFQGDSTYG